ncbi:MAG TPA: helix-turn-helix transcriptional regulator [Alphaproteobacteria bacterium]|nr:helix-turn-helix transcriptional regulator [Alphaproteobacteria bacterium]
MEQIRAARALLGWSQSDLAARAGLSQTGIARIENGTNHPNSQTLSKIQNAFDEADIEFLDLTGVKKRTGEVKILKGQEGLRSFFDDVYETARTQGGEICLFNGVPDLLTKWLGEEWYSMHSQRMRALRTDFSMKIIVKQGESHLIAQDFAEYRWFPPNMFNEKTIYVYGSTIGFLDFDESALRIIMLKQKDLAESFRVLFNIAWDDVAKKF